MLLHLSDADVDQLVPLDAAIRVTEDLFRLESTGGVHNRPTVELPLQRGFFRLKAGAVYGFKSYGFKAYGGGRYIVFVYSTEDNSLYGIVEAHRLSEIRTGAVSAVGAKYMARPDAERLAIIGTGREARTQVPAICQVRPIRSVTAYSRNATKREAFAEEMSKKLGLPVVASPSAEACVDGADIVVTMTSSSEPVLEGAWLSPGTFICAVGATTPGKRELDDDAVARAGTIAVEHLPQARAELGEFQHAEKNGRFSWENVRELKDIVAGTVPGRIDAKEVTLFDTIGVGSEDVALAAYAIERARGQGLGQTLPL
jgi:alanine dehydrogenase